MEVDAHKKESAATLQLLHFPLSLEVDQGNHRLLRSKSLRAATAVPYSHAVQVS